MCYFEKRLLIRFLFSVLSPKNYKINNNSCKQCTCGIKPPIFKTWFLLFRKIISKKANCREKY